MPRLFRQQDMGWRGYPTPESLRRKIKWEVVAAPNETSGAMKPSDVEQCRAIAEAMAAKVKGA